MPKATRKNSTKTKSRPREGLDLIDATYQRKTAHEPNLKRELKPLRHSNDVTALDKFTAREAAKQQTPAVTIGDAQRW